MHNILSVLIKLKLRLKQSVHYQLAYNIFRFSLILTLLFLLHIAAMMHYEKMGLGDAVWLTFTTATTVGYGDLSASTTAGRVATIVLLYLGGIFILAKVVGDYFDYRMEIRDKKLKGQWSWKMKNHIVILNTPSHAGGRYLERLIHQFRLSDQFADTSIYLLTRQFPQGLPGFITDLGEVVHYHGYAGHPQDLRKVAIDSARIIIVLARDEGDDTSDGRTFDILHRLKAFQCKARILAECVDDDNRARLQQAGADVVIRPMRAYPEMIVRAFVTPGSEAIIENMFNCAGDEYRRYDVEFSHLKWCEVVTRLITRNMGIAVAYIDRNTQQVVYNPSADSVPDCQALITICKDYSAHSHADIQAMLREDS